MSYQPEPDDWEEEHRRIYFLRYWFIDLLFRRLFPFDKERPVAFWLRLWLTSIFFLGIIIPLAGLESLDRPSEKLVLLFAILGWIIPFVFWIKAKKAGDK